MQLIGIAFALFTAFCFAWASLFMKKGLYKASTESGVLYTLISNGAMFSLALPFIFLQGIPEFHPVGLGFFLLSGILGPVFGRFSLYASIRRIGATRSASIKITAPAFSAIIAWVLLGELLSLQMIAAIFVIIGGVYLVTASPVGTGTASEAKSGFVFGFLAAVFFAATNVSRKAGLNYISSAILGSAVSTLIALVAFVIYYLIKGRLKELIVIEKSSIARFTVGGILSGLAMLGYFMALKYIPVSAAMAVANIEPLITILLAHASKLDDEPISIKFLGGAAVVLLGVTLIILD